MKKRVNNKISFRIAMIVGIVVTLEMLLLFAVVNLNLSMELTNRVKRDMNLIAKDRSQIIETYIEGCVEMIDAYARTPEIRGNLRIRARSIRLSDSDRVIIMTLTDVEREEEN